MRLAQKCAINKKSTILMLPSWNFGNLTQPWGGHFNQISSKLDKNWQFFVNSTFFSQFTFSCPLLYIIEMLDKNNGNCVKSTLRNSDNFRNLKCWFCQKCTFLSINTSKITASEQNCSSWIPKWPNLVSRKMLPATAT